MSNRKQVPVSAAGRLLLDIYDVLKEPPAWEVWTRFMAKVIMRAPHECWEWSGSHANSYKPPYAAFADGERRKQYDVQRAWGVWIFGEIEIQNLVMDHFVCSNARCINPTHLLPVTIQFNNNRPGSQTVTAINLRKTHCPRGHELIYRNCVRSDWGKGKRCCKICRAEDQVDRDQSKRLRADRPSQPLSMEQLFNEIRGRNTHCPQGHELTWQTCVETELRRGYRRCKICNNALQAERVKARYHRKKEAGLIVPKPKRTHCREGHELTIENCVPYELTRGTKTCLICSTERSMHRDRRKAK